MVTGKCRDTFRGIFLVERGELRRELHGRIFLMSNFLWGKKISMKEVHDFLALFEKTMNKKNMKTFFY